MGLGPRLVLFLAAPLQVRTGPSAAARSPFGSRQELDLSSCAREYPAYTEYLDQNFGNRFANPGDLVKPAYVSTLVLNLSLATDGRPELRVEQAGYGKGYKREALRQLLLGVLERHGELLRPDLDAVGGSVQLHWRWMNGDAPQRPLSHLGLPLHGWSSDRLHDDVAMPDFTFENYPHIMSESTDRAWRSNSWRDVAARLQTVRRTKSGFIWRGAYSNEIRNKLVNKVAAGPPEHLRPLLDKLAPDGLNVSLMDWDSKGLLPPGGQDGGFVSLYEQCQWPYTFHMAGRHYSAYLKYKLACNQTVFMVKNKAEEFWYRALKHGENVFFVRDDLADLWDVVEEALAPPQAGGQPAGARAAAVAAAGRHLVDTYLSQEGIDCYVMLYLKNYYLPLIRRAHALQMSTSYDWRKMRPRVRTI